MISTIFPNSNQDLDACIALYSDPYSRVALSGVNRAAYVMLSNGIFKNLFMQEHPLIKEDIGAHALDLLCVCHPNNCWKVASCVFWKVASCVFTRDTFKLSASFLREPFPLFQSSLQSKKKQTEIEIKNLCGSYFADPDSQIDQAWKAFKNSEKALEESKVAFISLRDCDDFGSENLEVIQAHDKIKLSCSKADDFLIKFFIYQFASATYEDRLQHVDFSSSKTFKLDASFEIDVNIIDELIEFTSPHAQSLFNMCLFDEYFILFKFVFSKYFERGLKVCEKEEFYENYCNIESNRKKYSEKLDKINRCLDLLGPSSKRDDSSFVVTKYSDFLLTNQLSRLMFMELTKKVKIYLDKCIVLMDEVNQHPENLDLLHSIRHFINLCPDFAQIEIWGNLYNRCANGVIEDNWSENHYGEFLPVLKEVIEGAYGINSKMHEKLTEDFLLDQFEKLINEFIESA